MEEYNTIILLNEGTHLTIGDTYESVQKKIIAQAKKGEHNFVDLPNIAGQSIRINIKRILCFYSELNLR